MKNKRGNYLCGTFLCFFLAVFVIYWTTNNSLSIVFPNQSIEEKISELDGQKHRIIILMPGEYEQIVHLRDNNVHLIGFSKNKTVIFCKSGRYDDSPIFAYGNFRLSNLTVKMFVDESINWQPTYLNFPEDYPGYALHIEGDNIQPDSMATAVIKNCDFYSEASTAVGMGLHNNQTVSFIHCNFVRFCKKKSYKRDNYRGAFLVHCSPTEADQNELLILKDCYFYSNYGYIGIIRGDLEGSSAMEITAINNQFWSAEMGEDCLVYLTGESRINEASQGNTATNLNYREGVDNK